MADSKTQTTVTSGIGFTGLLTIVFITLKLLGVIDWSWLWVLSPLWISVALGVAGFLLVIIVPLLIVGIAAIVAAVSGK